MPAAVMLTAAWSCRWASQPPRPLRSELGHWAQGGAQVAVAGSAWYAYALAAGSQHDAHGCAQIAIVTTGAAGTGVLKPPELCGTLQLLVLGCIAIREAGEVLAGGERSSVVGASLLVSPAKGGGSLWPPSGREMASPGGTKRVTGNEAGGE